MMLILFDIDGTLVRTYPREDEHYDAALEHVGLSLPTTDYVRLGASTDVSILRVLSQRAWGRDPRIEEIEAVRRAHTAAWEADLANRPLETTPGARDAIARMQRLGHEVAAATGGFRVTASMKLRAANIELSIAAAAEDGRTRRALLASAAGERDDVMYIGDGTWDADAATFHGWRFIGVGARAATFRSMGLEALDDLRELDP